MIKEIIIEKELSFEEVKDRLKNVKLRGFPNVQIYDNADITIENFSPERIKLEIFTPQPTVYRKGFLDRIEELANIFSKSGINIFRLNGGIDYIAIDENNNQTKWTLIPPVIEINEIEFDENKKLNYSNILDPLLVEELKKSGYGLNPEINNLDFKEYNKKEKQFFPIICDGSHRLHCAFEKGINQNLLVIINKKRFPYYAAPKPYSTVHVELERPAEGSTDKTHVLKEPAHKLLYRLFPSGGILAGEVRAEKK